MCVCTLICNCPLPPSHPTSGLIFSCCKFLACSFDYVHILNSGNIYLYAYVNSNIQCTHVYIVCAYVFVEIELFYSIGLLSRFYIQCYTVYINILVLYTALKFFDPKSGYQCFGKIGVRGH